jgi:hypothetical protein
MVVVRFVKVIDPPDMLRRVLPLNSSFLQKRLFQQDLCIHGQMVRWVSQVFGVT